MNDTFTENHGGLPGRGEKDELASLTGGGPFAALFVPPDVTLSPVEDTWPTRRRSAPIVIASLVSLGLVLGATTFALKIARSRARAPVAPTAGIAANAPTEAPASLAPAPVSVAVTATASVASKPARPPVARPSRVDVKPPSTTPAATPNATARPSKCCTGESEMACQMRLSVGAICGG